MASSFYVHSFVTVSLKGVSIYKCLIKRWQGIIEKNVFFKTSREINKKSNVIYSFIPKFGVYIENE